MRLAGQCCNVSVPAVTEIEAIRGFINPSWNCKRAFVVRV